MRSLALLALLVTTTAARAQEPKEEPAPPPRVLVPAPPINLFAPYRAHGTMEVWKNYAVDQSGRFRPRVIAAPFGSYYYYNGQPFPWTSTNPTYWRSATRD